MGFKTTKVMVLSGCLMLLTVVAVHAKTVNLSWDPSPDSDIAGYKIYYKADSSTLPFNSRGAKEGTSPIDVGNVLNSTLSDLPNDQIHYVAVTAYNAKGEESTFSNIVTSQVAPGPAVHITSIVPEIYHSRDLQLDYTVSDGSVQIFLDGKSISIEPGGILSRLSNGQHTLRIESVDASGNLGSAEINFTVFVQMLAAVPDITGNAADELAVLDMDANGLVFVNLNDSKTGERIRSVNFPSSPTPMFLNVIPDLDGNSAAELAVLGVLEDGTVRINIKDSATGEWVGAQFFPADPAPIACNVFPDMNGNGTAELAVPGLLPDGTIRINIKDSATGDWIAVNFFPADPAPISFSTIPDLNGNGALEQVVLGTLANGTVRINIKDSTTGDWVGANFFPAGSTSLDFHSMPDMNGNDTPEIAVLGILPDSSVRVNIKDSITGAWVGAKYLPSDPEPISFATLADVDGNGSNELGTLGIYENGTLRINVKDSATGAWVNAVTYPAGEPTP